MKINQKKIMLSEQTSEPVVTLLSTLLSPARKMHNQTPFARTKDRAMIPVPSHILEATGDVLVVV
jgi:hypothetical protein